MKNTNQNKNFNSYKELIKRITSNMFRVNSNNISKRTLR